MYPRFMSDDTPKTDVMQHHKGARPNAFKQDQVAGSPHVWDETISKMVLAMASTGTPSRAIVAAVGLSWSTIHKHYRKEIDEGMSSVETRLSNRVLDIAEGKIYQKDDAGEDTPVSLVPIKDSLAASKYYLGTRFGWKETSVTELTGKDGGPLETINSEMTPQQAAELYARTRDGESGDSPEDD